MFLPLSLGIIRFSAPPLLSVLPQGQIRILPEGQKKIWRPLGAILPPPTFFSAHAKINPVHATVTGIIETVTYKGFFRTTFCYDLKCNMDINV